MTANLFEVQSNYQPKSHAAFSYRISGVDSVAVLKHMQLNMVLTIKMESGYW
jgi:hypothetical protein